MIGSNPIKTQNFVREIFSDSSLSGWGSFYDGQSTFGFWDIGENKNHINFLELQAAFFALKCFASDLSECEVLLRLDNTTAIAYINKAGGIQYPHLSDLSQKIWKWCEERKIWIKAAYIRSDDNVEADAASRYTNIDTEWKLNPEAFTQITNEFGPFSIDFFATRLHKKCPRYFSRLPDPEVEAVDVFTKSWKKEYFYGFPPFSIILKSLRKIINDKTEGVLVVPLCILSLLHFSVNHPSYSNQNSFLSFLLSDNPTHWHSTFPWWQANYPLSFLEKRRT